jgi:hypothetical protein
MAFSFKCSSCDRIHHGMLTFEAAAPLSYYGVPEAEREARCRLGTDDCVIDDEYFFVRGSIEIHVHGEPEPFSWGVWVSLSEKSYESWKAVFGVEKRSHVGPFFGWLDAALKP